MSKKSSPTSTTQTLTVETAPKLPTLRLQLRQPLKLKFSNDDEKKKILKKLDKRGNFDPEKIKRLNDLMKSSLRESLNEFVEQVMKYLDVTPEDTEAAANWKIKNGDDFIDGIERVFGWIVKQLAEIFQIKDNKDRKKRMEELYEKLDTILKNCVLPEEPSSISDVTEMQEGSSSQQSANVEQIKEESETSGIDAPQNPNYIEPSEDVTEVHEGSSSQQSANVEQIKEESETSGMDAPQNPNYKKSVSGIQGSDPRKIPISEAKQPKSQKTQQQK